MENNNLLKFLIPIIAVVVVFESIVLVTNLDKGLKTNTDTKNTTEATDSAAVQNLVKEESVVELVFATASKEMKVGKNYKVELNMMGKQDLMVDGIETYIKYDPSLVTVSGLVSNNKLPKATISKINTKDGVVENAILIDEKSGYKVEQNKTNLILSFNVTPRKEGEISFEISSGNGNKEFVTMIVENTTGKQLVFSSNKLDINAIK